VRIDIRSETQDADGETSGGYAAELGNVEYAEGEWVENPDSGEMEWHAADGSVMSQAEWSAQTSGESEEEVEPSADSEGESGESDEENAEAGDDGSASQDEGGEEID